MIISLYGLADEALPGILRYVGATNNVAARETLHFSYVRKPPKSLQEIWKRAMNRLGRRARFYLLDEIDVATDPRKHGVSWQPEIDLMHEVAASGGWLLNRELVRWRLGEQGLSMVVYRGYLADCRAGVCEWDRGALERAMRVEQRFPDILHALTIGNLGTLLLDQKHETKKPRRRRFSQRPRCETIT